MSGDRSTERMAFTFGGYLLDVLPALLIVVFGDAFMVGLLAVMGLSVAAIAVVCALPLLCLVVVLIWDYARKHRFWAQACFAAAEMEDARTFVELVERPSFMDGRLAFDMAASVAGCGAQQMTRILAQSSAQREYTELWAHEIKGPLAAARLAASGMHGESASALSEQLERIGAYIDQVLYAARAESVENDYLIRDVGLLDLCREACKQNMRSLVAHGVALDFDIPAETRVFADSAWLSFVISQLVLNAAKYDSTHIRFSSRDEQAETPYGHTVLEVADDGCGVPAADTPRVFDRGFTGEVGRSHGSATGMGLYLVAIMCAKMGLGIVFASEEGKGSRVTISFPHDRRLIRLTTM